MKVIIFSFLFFCFGLLLLQFSSKEHVSSKEVDITTNQWILIDERDDVKTYEKKIPDSGLVAFRGEATIDASVGRIYSVMKDFRYRPDWVYLLKEVKLLSTQTKFDTIERYHITIFWPIADRDFINRMLQIYNPSDGSLLIKMQYASDELYPIEANIIRGYIHHSIINLKPVSESKTYIEVEIFADPKGSVPAWAANLVQKEWPHYTLTGLKKLTSSTTLEIADPNIFEELKSATKNEIKNEIKKEVSENSINK
ncbi:MAG: hypothetical protein HQK49_15670 [Oligoflexia bacterium]|nr:hypothetical protein [Oligoflexia bacterium]